MLLTPISHLPSVKRKRNHSRISDKSVVSEKTRAKRLPPSCWDRLPKLSLSGYALEEQRRRFVHADATAASGPPLNEVVELGTLNQFARHGGPDLSDIRGSNPSQGKSSGPYDVNSEDNLIKGHVYLPDHECDNGKGTCTAWPEKMAELRNQLVTPRHDLTLDTFTVDDHRAWCKTLAQARTEISVGNKSFTATTGDMSILEGEDLFWNNLEPLIPGVQLKQAKPDFFDSTQPSQLSQVLLDMFGTLIIPSKQPQSPCMPNLITEIKGPKGTFDVLNRQALYSGALGERAMHTLMAYVGCEKEGLNTIRTLACTFIDSTLKIYCLHRTKRPKSNAKPHIHMQQLKAVEMTESAEEWIKGATVYRNAREMAKAWRDELVRKANAQANKPCHTVLKAATVSTSFESNESGGTSGTAGTTSTDELNPEYEGKRLRTG
ncbi:uncharacterized protein KY384_000019 [Bacidia gigantensis]|uniref:uncharacterized protein n=1 Tax=Bacidia gigantensis TaxID=2732470 RepID=UPI001D04CEE5|nr:uncharacterized protein KY384_000019 [Bacidia gigantensis]KAG8526426.1 hypothetical protein KY384_000019 [Bacidia gigantensis]